MIRAFSLQAQPEQKDRGFYAYGDHRPPPIYPKPQQSRPVPQQQRGAAVNSGRSSDHHMMNVGDYGRRVQITSQPSKKIAQSANGPAAIDGKNKINKDLRITSGKNDYVENPKGIQMRAQAKLASKVKKTAYQHQQVAGEMTPLLSEQGKRSHFGASTQMIIEDGQTSAHAIMLTNEVSLPFNRVDEGGSPGIYEFRTTNSNHGSKQVGPSPLLAAGLNSDSLTLGGELMAQKTKNKMKLKTFNRQMTTDYANETTLKLNVVDEDEKSFQQRSQAQRGSIVSENLEDVTDAHYNTASDNHINSAQQLTKAQLQMQPSFCDTHDQLSEVRRMELQMENLKLVKLNSLAHTSIGDQLGTYKTQNNMTSAAHQMEPHSPLNVVLPSNVQTGFQASQIERASSNEGERIVDLRTYPKSAPGKRSRAKTANTRGGRGKSLKGGKLFKDGANNENPSLVVMNERQMSIAAGATSAGIVSLYNKGFVPKKTGKVSKKSKLANASKTLYATEKGKEDAAAMAKQREERLAMGHSGQRDDISAVIRADMNVFSARAVGVEGGYLSSSNSGRHPMEQQLQEFTVACGKRALIQEFESVPVDRAEKIQREISLNSKNVGDKAVDHLLYVRQNTSQMYERNQMSSNTNLTNMLQSQAEKHSFQASEVVLQSVQALAGDGVIDYANKDSDADQSYEGMQAVSDVQDHNRIEKTQFKLPSNTDVIRKESMSVTPGQKSLGSTDFAKAVVAGRTSNDEQESRELTEPEEHILKSQGVSTPLVTKISTGEQTHQMRPINFLEKTTGSVGEQSRRDMLIYVAKDNNSSSDPADQTKDVAQAVKPVNRATSAVRKSVHSKQSCYNMAEGRKSVEKPPENRNQMASKITTNKSCSISKASSKSFLNKDLNNEVKNHRNENNYSHPAVIDRSLAKTQNSFKNTGRSPNETSLTNFAGNSLLQTRPLIGHQLVKNLTAAQRNKKILGNQLLRGASSQSQRSGSQTQPNRQIHFEISNLNSQGSGLEKGCFTDAVVVQNADKNFSIDQKRSPEAKTPKSNPVAVFQISARQPNRKNSNENVSNARLTGPSLGHLSSGIQLRSDAVLVSDRNFQQAQTLEQIASGSRIRGNAEILGSVGPQVELSAQMKKSEETSETQQQINPGKIRHVFLINQTSREQIKSSSREKSANTTSKRSREMKKRKRKNRPNSSRLAKRKAYQFDLINEKASDGEDIATIQGSSTSRHHLRSRNEARPGSAGGDYQGEVVVTEPLTYPNLKLHANEFITDTYRSDLKNLQQFSNKSLDTNSKKQLLEVIGRSGDGTITEQSLAQLKGLRHSAPSKTEMFSLEAQKIQTLQKDELLQSITRDSRMPNLNQQLQRGGVETNIHCSINDYLKNEEISGVQILDVHKSAFLSSNQPTQQNELNNSAVENLGNQHSTMPPSQVTVYKEQWKNQSKDVGVNFQQPALPQDPNMMQAIAMHSNNSTTQHRGTASLQFSQHDLITDPKLEIQTPKGQGGTACLMSPAQPEGFGDRVLYMSHNNMAANAADTAQLENNQMMIVTKIRVKNDQQQQFLTQHENSKQNLSYSSKGNDAEDTAKVTMDFNDQVDIRQLQPIDNPFIMTQSQQQQYGMDPSHIQSPNDYHGDAYMHQYPLYDQASNAVFSNAPVFSPNQHTNSSLFQPNNQQQATGSQNTPDLMRIGAADTITMTTGDLHSSIAVTGQSLQPLHGQTLQGQVTGPVLGITTSGDGKATVSLILAGDDNTPNNQKARARTIVPSGSLSPKGQLDLSGSIKRRRDFLEENNLIKSNASLHTTLQGKQDALLKRKAQSVLPRTIPTVPEKSQFRDKSGSNRLDTESLSIVGQKTHSITKQQLETHLRNTIQAQATDNQIPEDENEVCEEVKNTAIQNSMGTNAMAGQADLDQSLLMSNHNLASREEHSDSVMRIERGLQITHRGEDITSLSNGSRSNNALLIQEQSRRTVQTAGFNNPNIPTETYMRHPSTAFRHQEGDEDRVSTNEHIGGSNLENYSEQQRQPESFMSQPRTRNNLRLASNDGFSHARATSQDVVPVKIIPVNQSRQPTAIILGNAIQQTRTGELMRSPPGLRITEEYGTELSTSPYIIMKNRLLSSTHNPQPSQDHVKVAECQVDFSNRVSERLYLSSEQMSNQNTNSTKKLLAPNQDLADLTARMRLNDSNVAPNGAQQVNPSSFFAQNQGKDKLASAGEITLERDALNDMIDPEVVDAKDGTTNTIRPHHRHIDSNLSYSQKREELNNTALLRVQQREKSETAIRKDDLRYSTASNLSSNARSAKQLQAAKPANFDVKITKVGSQGMQSANQSKLNSTKTFIGDYQGAPPNNFMRRGSRANSSSIRLTPQLENYAQLGGEKDTNNGLVAQGGMASHPDFGVGRSSGLGMQALKSSGASGTGISVALVEARNQITGLKKKIVKSAVQSTELDQQSNQTQTEVITATKDHHTMTLDYNQNYSSAHKLPSDNSFNILPPRGGVGYQPDGTPTLHNSIQVTIGRVTQNSTMIGKVGDVVGTSTAAVSMMGAKRVSQFTVAEKQEADRKISQSKSRIFEDLGTSLYQVGQKSLQQLGVSSQITYQQSFNKIKESVKRQNDLKEKHQAFRDSQEQTIENPSQRSLLKNGSENSSSVANLSLAQAKTMRNSLKAHGSQLLPVDLQGGILEAILENQPSMSNKNVAAGKSKSRRVGGKKRQVQRNTLSRDGLKASQKLIEFSSFQKNQNHKQLMMSSSSGIFDPNGDILRFTTNNRAVQREEPDYSKQSAMRAMMAKRQKAGLEQPNRPLPALNTTPSNFSGVLPLEALTTNFIQQTHATPLNSNNNTNLRYNSANTCNKPPRQTDPINIMSTLNSDLKQPINQNQTISALSNNFEQEMERAEEQYREHKLRTSSHSAQYQLRPDRVPSSKRIRPISSGNYVTAKRSSNIVTNLGAMAQHNQSIDKNTYGGKLSRPLTAQNRSAILSAKARQPSLNHRESSYGGIGLNNHNRNAASKVQTQTASETQASSLNTSALPGRRTTTKVNPGSKNFSVNIAHTAVAVTPIVNFNNPQLNSGGVHYQGGNRSLVQRNMASEYATTYTAPLGAGQALKNKRGSSPLKQAQYQQNPQQHGRVDGLQSGRRTRPFSGVYRVSQGKSLGGHPIQSPSIMTSLNNQSQLANINEQNNQIATVSYSRV